MKKKIVSALFITSFMISGCGIESIFDGCAIEWLFAFMVAIGCILVLTRK